MPDIPLEEAQLVWTLMEGEDGPPIRVVNARGMDDDRYLTSWGACNGDFQQADADTKLKMLLSEYVHLTVNEGINPKAVHEALMVIPEYRRNMADAAVISPLDDEEDAE